MAAEMPLPLTLEEHSELGKEMRLSCARFSELQKLMVGVYGPHSTAAVNFSRIVEAVERVQSEMEYQAARDLPGLRVEGLYR